MPFAILIPLIVYVCAIGAYAVNTSTTDIWYIMLYGCPSGRTSTGD